MIQSQKSHPKVAVIVGYFNGNKYLSAQIQSILNQSHKNIEIHIFDDFSENEIDISRLRISPEDKERVYFHVNSANFGFTKNFLGALENVNIWADFIAFSDQDDIWHFDKIAAALECLEKYPKNTPALYCARTITTDETCQIQLGTSPLFSKPPSFANAMVQNIGGGNTMVFNNSARSLIVQSTKNTDVVSHDWWCYQIIAGANGIVYYDPSAYLKYRQHSANLVGANNNWVARMIRIKGLFSKKFRRWNDTNLAALSKNRALLTEENQMRLDNFIEARRSNLLKRILLFKRAGIYRQTLFGNVGLFLAVIFNKV